jgi:stage V sporulation protein B
VLLAFAAINLLIDQLGNMCHNQLIAVEKMVIPAIISTVHILSLILMAGLALTLHGGLWGLYIASMIAGIGRMLAYWWMVWRLKIRPSFPIDRRIARSLVIDGAPLALSALLTLAYTHTDKLLTTALIGTEGTGNLTAGFVIVFGITELLSITVLVAVFPLMSRAYASGMREMFNFMVEKLSFFNLLVSLPIGIYMSLLAVPLASLLFGPDFTRVAGIMRILIWYTVVNMIAAVFAQGLIIQHRQRRLLTIRTGGLLVNIVLNLILLPRMGVNGSATANLIAESGVLLLMLRSFDLPAEWWQRGISHLWRLALAGVGLAVMLLLMSGIHPLLAAIIGAPVYLGLILVSGAIAKDDWDLIYRMSIAMPGGTVIGRYWKRELV